MDSLASFDLGPSIPAKNVQESQLAIIPVEEPATKEENLKEDSEICSNEDSTSNQEERRFVFVDSPEHSDEARWLRRWRTRINVDNSQMVPDVWKDMAGSFNRVAARGGDFGMEEENNLSEEGIQLDHIDFLGPAEAIKNLAQLPYSDRPFSMALHRMGRTLVVDANIEDPSHNASDQDPHQRPDNHHHSPFARSRNLPDCSQTDQPGEDVSQEDHGRATSDPVDVTSPVPNELSPADSSEPSDSLVEPPRPFYIPPAPKRTMKLYQWQLDELKLALTSNLVACARSGSDDRGAGGMGHSEVNIKVVHPGEQLTQCTCLDYYLENVIANIPELALCLRNKGYIQSYKLVKTEEIPFLGASGNVEVDSPPIFDPKAVELNASMLLRFLQENCQQEGRTYILHREENGGAVQLYDLTALSQERLRKWKWLLAMLCYRFALRISQHIRLVDTASRAKLLNRQRKLLSTCLDLLHELAVMGGGRHETICAAVQEQIAESYLEHAEEQSTPLASPDGTKVGEDFSFQDARPDLEVDRLSEDTRSTAGLSGTVSGTGSLGISIENLEQAREHLARGAAILRSLLHTYHQSSLGNHYRSEVEAGLPPAINETDHLVQGSQTDGFQAQSEETLFASANNDEADAGSVGSNSHSELGDMDEDDADARTAVAIKLAALEEKLLHTCSTLGRELLQMHQTDTSLQAMDVLAQAMEHWISAYQLQVEYLNGWEDPDKETESKHKSMMTVAMTLWELNADCIRTATLWLSGESAPAPSLPGPREIIAALSPFLGKAEVFRTQLFASCVSSPEKDPGAHILSSMEWNQLDVCKLVHTSRMGSKHSQHRPSPSFLPLPCLQFCLGEVSNETGLADALVQWKAQLACVLCYHLALLCCLETKEYDVISMSKKNLMLKIGDASNEVGKLLSQFIKACLTKNIQLLDQLHSVIPTCMATCISWFEEALRVFIKVGEAAKSHAALACLNLSSVVKLQTRLGKFLPSDCKVVERWFLRSLDLTTQGHTVLGVRVEGGPNCRLWDMLSEEAAMSHLALGLHRKRQLPKVQDSAGSVLKSSPPEERSVLQPFETALRIYTKLNNLSQMAAVNYQLGAFYMAIWKNQVTILKQEAYFNTALAHMRAAFLHFSEQEKGSTYLIILADLCELHLQAPDSSPSAYIDQLTHCISMVLEIPRIKESGFFKKGINTADKNRVLSKTYKKLTQLLHQVLKYLMRLGTANISMPAGDISSDSSDPSDNYKKMTHNLSLFKQMYKDALNITQLFEKRQAEHGLFQASKFLVEQIELLRVNYLKELLL